MDRGLSLTEYSGALKPKTSLGISAFAQYERKTHGYLGATPAAIGLCQGDDTVAFYVPLLEYPQSWLERLAMREFITEMADSLGSLSESQ